MCRRLVCSDCGYTKDQSNPLKEGIEPREEHDYCFRLPLWLRAPCGAETLWAYNLRHLEFIEAVIGAAHRERTRNERGEWRNNSLASRLPEWMKLAKNRQAVLKAVRGLKEKLQARPW